MMLVTSNFLLPAGCTHLGLWLRWRIPALPSHLALLSFSLISILGDDSSCLVHPLCPISQWRVSVGFCSSQPSGGYLSRFPLNPAPRLRFIRERTRVEPVLQNKTTTIHGINGSLSSEASVTDRSTVRIDVAGPTQETDYIYSIHWLRAKI